MNGSGRGRRLGELIRAQKETVGLNRGAAGAGKKDAPCGSLIESRDTSSTLADAGIDKKLSGRDLLRPKWRID